MKKIKSSLIKITNPKEAKSGEILEAIKFIDQCLEQENNELSPRLKHFLQNRSYLKALNWIEGEQVESGICGQ